MRRAAGLERRRLQTRSGQQVARWLAGWSPSAQLQRRKDSVSGRRMAAASCYVIIVLRRGGAGLSVDEADEHGRGCARASVAVEGGNAG